MAGHFFTVTTVANRVGADSARAQPAVRLRAAMAGLVAALALSGCVSVFNAPINVPATAPQAAALASGAIAELPIARDDATVVGLAFSGGGTRAAAYSYGLLQELEATRLPGGRSLLDQVRFVSGTSGGSVTAAYFGLRGPQGYHDLYQRFLTADGETNMRTHVTPVNLLRAVAGGVNNRSAFGRWLDQHVFDGLTYAAFNRPGAPITWINATDLSTSTPFVFNDQTFAALCSDLNQLPISEAVAASAAVPVVFAPIVMESFGATCPYALPAWLTSVAANPDASAELRGFQEALVAYRTPGRVSYAKLVDGGIVNDFGITGFTIARAQAGTAYGPLTARQAVRLQRAIFLIADASLESDPAWARTASGPALPGLIEALTDAAEYGTIRAGYDAFRLTMMDWRNDLVRYRCGLSEGEVRRLRGSLSGWDCRGLELHIARVSFDSLDPGTRAGMEQVPTRLVLPLPQVELSIHAGRQALRANPDYIRALRSLGIR